MRINRTQITIICAILALSIFSGLSVWIYSKELQPKSEPILKNTSPTLPPAEKKLNAFVPPIFNSGMGTVMRTTFEVKVVPTFTAPFFESINKAAKTAEKSLMANNAPDQNTSTTTSTGIVLSLTQDQFHFLYPENFITGLIDAQNYFIKEYDSNYEPLSKIETDPQVRLVEEKIVATLLSADMITKERADQFITTIRFTLPQLQIMDLEKHGSYGFFYEFPIFIESPQAAPKGTFLSGLMEELANALARKAQAAVCGTCSSLPECFQSGAPTPLPGTEVVKFACYCTGCLSSLGCLSSCAGPAIYDQTTGICGCGL